MQIWAESGKSALPICNYSQILYQFLTFTQNLKRSLYLTHKQFNNRFTRGCRTNVRQPRAALSGFTIPTRPCGLLTEPVSTVSAPRKTS